MSHINYFCIEKCYKGIIRPLLFLVTKLIIYQIRNYEFEYRSFGKTSTGHSQCG